MSPETSTEPSIPHVIDTSSPLAENHRPSDPSVQSDFDARVETDRGRESSNGGYLANTFETCELNPPLAPGSHRYVGPHEPLNFDEKLSDSSDQKRARADAPSMDQSKAQAKLSDATGAPQNKTHFNS